MKYVRCAQIEGDEETREKRRYTEMVLLLV